MQLLWAVAHGLESTSSRMRRDLGVTGPQRLVLRLIAHFGVAAPGDLAEVLHVHPSSLTGNLRRLEGAGLIRRKRDPNDGRRSILTLTPRGRTLNEQQHGTVESSVRRALKTISPGDVAIARRVLRALARELGVDAA
jgi:DNA-binding MarR family transcriptional regulator